VQISLQKVNCVLLTVEKYHHRYLEVMERCKNKLSPVAFYGVDMPRPHGCDYSIIKLYSTVEPPVLIIEDDVAFTEHYTDTFEVPDDADAVYLGTSSWGANNGVSGWKNIELTPYNDLLFRVHGMASTHAILYLSQRYLQHLNNVTFKQYTADSAHGIDYYISQEQKNFNVYAVRQPMLYQNDGGNTAITSYSLDQVYKDNYGA
jgi:hypothetical protein